MFPLIHFISIFCALQWRTISLSYAARIFIEVLAPLPLGHQDIQIIFYRPISWRIRHPSSYRQMPTKLFRSSRVLVGSPISNDLLSNLLHLEYIDLVVDPSQAKVFLLDRNFISPITCAQELKTKRQRKILHKGSSPHGSLYHFPNFIQELSSTTSWLGTSFLLLSTMNLSSQTRNSQTWWISSPGLTTIWNCFLPYHYKVITDASLSGKGGILL